MFTLEMLNSVFISTKFNRSSFFCLSAQPGGRAGPF